MAVAAGFDVFGLVQIVSFTATVNAPSIAVMRRLGMTHEPADDFEHPSLPVDHPLRRHVLYRLRSYSRMLSTVAPCFEPSSGAHVANLTDERLTKWLSGEVCPSYPESRSTGSSAANAPGVRFTRTVALAGSPSSFWEPARFDDFNR